MSLREALESFINGRISLGQLIQDVKDAAPLGEEAREELGNAFEVAFQGGKLSQPAYAALTSALSAEDEERTRLACLPVLDGDEDATRVQVSRPYADDATPQKHGVDATMIDDRTRAAPSVNTPKPGPSHDLPAAVYKPTQAESEATLAMNEDPLPNPTYTGSDTGRVDLSRITTGGIAKDLLDTLAGENLTASSALAPGQELSVGVVLKDRFVLKEVLGKGGMGAVFKALDLRKVEANDREAFVALKVLNQDFRDNPVSFMALQRETKRAQTLSHPNIITVYDFDRDGDHVFMTMEHLQGRPLNTLIRDLLSVGMPFKKAWPLIQGMGAALAYAHRKNIVHSDFKPGNVFVTGENEVKVLDFGIATAIARPGQAGERQRCSTPAT